MEAILRSETVTFTNGSDVDMVIGKYRSFFESVAENANVLSFGARMEPEAGGGVLTHRKAKTVHWSSEEMRTFSKSLVQFRRCRELILGGHALTAETELILTEFTCRLACPAAAFIKTLRWSCGRGFKASPNSGCLSLGSIHRRSVGSVFSEMFV